MKRHEKPGKAQLFLFRCDGSVLFAGPPAEVPLPDAVHQTGQGALFHRLCVRSVASAVRPFMFWKWQCAGIFPVFPAGWGTHEYADK